MEHTKIRISERCEVACDLESEQRSRERTHMSDRGSNLRRPTF